MPENQNVTPELPPDLPSAKGSNPPPSGAGHRYDEGIWAAKADCTCRCIAVIAGGAYMVKTGKINMGSLSAKTPSGMLTLAVGTIADNGNAPPAADPDRRVGGIDEREPDVGDASQPCATASTLRLLTASPSRNRQAIVVPGFHSVWVMSAIRVRPRPRGPPSSATAIRLSGRSDSALDSAAARWSSGTNRSMHIRIWSSRCVGLTSILRCRRRYRVPRRRETRPEDRVSHRPSGVRQGVLRPTVATNAPLSVGDPDVVDAEEQGAGALARVARAASNEERVVRAADASDQ